MGSLAMTSSASDAENIHDTPCQCFADVRQRAAGKVAPDCRCALRHAHLTRLHAELFAEAGVCDKAAVQRHVFSHIHIQKLAHRGVKVSPAGKFQHRVAVFLIMEDHTLQRALQFHRIVEG